MPFFGILLMGAKGAAVIIGLAILSVYTAWGIYKLKMTAWWLTVLMLIALAASTIITFMFTKVADYYKLIGYSEEQIKNIQNLNMPYLIYYCVGSVSVMLGYMFFILKYFKKEKPSEILPIVESKD
jgi:multisubunit Na+/H+ antiporter MnhB subunit